MEFLGYDHFIPYILGEMNFIWPLFFIHFGRAVLPLFILVDQAVTFEQVRTRRDDLISNLFLLLPHAAKILSELAKRPRYGTGRVHHP